MSLSAAALLCVGCASATSQAHDARSVRTAAPKMPFTGPRRRGDRNAALRAITFFSPALQRRDYYLIHLPPGYSAAVRKGIRFPVLYLLHGDGVGNRHTVIHMYEKGRVGTTANRLVTSGQIQRFLIVMPEADDGTRVDDMEWANTKRGSFEDEVTDLVRTVDAHWSTIPDRSARAIAGLSMGGYGAVNIALRHPQLFATVESWSGYFTQTPTAVFERAPSAELRANSPAAYVRAMGTSLQRFPMRFLLYGGITDPLTRQQAPFAAELRGLGVPVQTATFSGPHDFVLWRKQMPLALGYASQGMGGPG